MDLRADQARGARCQLQQRIRVRGDEGGIGAGRVLEQLQLDTELRPEFLRPACVKARDLGPDHGLDATGHI